VNSQATARRFGGGPVPPRLVALEAEARVAAQDRSGAADAPEAGGQTAGALQQRRRGRENDHVSLLSYRIQAVCARSDGFLGTKEWSVSEIPSTPDPGARGLCSVPRQSPCPSAPASPPLLDVLLTGLLLNRLNDVASAPSGRQDEAKTRSQRRVYM
jgi:hypothetical protein